MSRHLTIGIAARLIASFAAVIVINLGASFVADDRLGFIRSNNELSRQSYETMLGLQDLFASIVAQYAALDRFLASGESEALMPFKNGQETFEKRSAESGERTAM